MCITPHEVTVSNQPEEVSPISNMVWPNNQFHWNEVGDYPVTSPSLTFRRSWSLHDHQIAQMATILSPWQKFLYPGQHLFMVTADGENLTANFQVPPCNGHYISRFATIPQNHLCKKTETKNHTKHVPVHVTLKLSGQPTREQYTWRKFWVKISKKNRIRVLFHWSAWFGFCRSLEVKDKNETDWLYGMIYISFPFLI